jgi:hypothetical protein
MLATALKPLSVHNMFCWSTPAKAELHPITIEEPIKSRLVQGG